MHLPFAATALAERHQAGQSRIGGSVGWVDQDRHAVGQIETAADNQSRP